MAQSLISGTTCYNEQSIKEIRKDIVKWSKQAKEIKKLFQKKIANLERSKYWDKVSYEFASLCKSIPRICETFCEDFKIVIKAIDGDNITQRDIDLMKNIYNCVVENEERIWKTFKNRDGNDWRDYGNPQFRKVEILYSEGRSFF